MTEDQFWNLIAESRSVISAVEIEGNMERQNEKLAELLGVLSLDGAEEFYRFYLDLWGEAYTWDLWCAATIIEGGCSDDGFMDFRSWLVSMGKEAYEKALENPESLAVIAADPTIEVCGFEGFPPVSEAVIDRAEDWSHPQEPAGEPFSEPADLKARLPAVWARFGWES